MTRLQKIQAKWNLEIDQWQTDLVQNRPIQDDHVSLDGTRDCWRGLVRPLMNIALTEAGAGFKIPERVSEEQKKQGKRYVGDSGVELFGDMSSIIPKREARVGDVIVFIFKKRTHVALVIDKRTAAHATDAGVCRSPLRAVMRVATKVLRYNGPGAEIFASQ